MGVLGALYERERTGKGRRIEINMLEAAIAFIPDPFANHTQMGIPNDPLTRVATSHSFAFRCADGKLLGGASVVTAEVLGRTADCDRTGPISRTTPGSKPAMCGSGISPS